MSNYVWFDPRQIIAGTTDLASSGEAMRDVFDHLDRITELEQLHPAGNDDTGRAFQEWYEEFRQQIKEQTLQVGVEIVAFGTDTEQTVAMLTAIDLENAESLTFEE
jgi:hypothetical protein